MEEYSQEHKHAIKAVKELKSFYIHLFVYIAVAIALLLIHIFSTGNWKDFFISGPILFWGIGLLAHGCAVFIPHFIFTKEWETKKIQKIMNKYDQASNSSNPHKGSDY